MIPHFKRIVWWILFGYTLSLFGTGMTEPYLVPYLYQLRGIPLSWTGMIIGISGLAGVIAVPVSGWLAELFDTKRIFLSMLLLGAVGRIFFAYAENLEIAFLASIVSGAGAAGSWNALSVILAESVPQSQRNSIFGAAFALQNLGSGLGAAVSGRLIDLSSLASFQHIFFLDAATFIIFALFCKKWTSDSQQEIIKKTSNGLSKTSKTKSLLRDKAMIGLSFSYLILAVIMSGLTTTLFPLWTTDQARQPVSLIGRAFLVNSLVIVLGQVFVLQMIRNRLRTRAIAIAVLFYLTGCLIMFGSGFLQRPAASIGLISSLGVTAIGETLLFSCLPALINDIAPYPLTTWYNSLINATWQAGSIIGPVLAGWILSHHQSILLFMVFILALGLLIPLLVMLEHFIPVTVNRVKQF
ncbi:MFS transporter [Sporolactobacillus putidus]|uniref:MFS transporter n=1 Tax=Sporolactobacillus putidus TaxID=492735 RepID=A0A917S7T1_9BACL|nr:MFS transporter [Sporolactobacillus putidus]GGL61809.1 MFS transporter [Sporolactobacillus putidus]